MTDASSHSLAGRLLVAMPGIGDPRFERAVVFLCLHDDEHAMGLTVNRPIEGLTFANLLERLDVKSASTPRADLVLMGGPVEPERGFVKVSFDRYEALLEEFALAAGGGGGELRDAAVEVVNVGAGE